MTVVWRRLHYLLVVLVYRCKSTVLYINILRLCVLDGHFLRKHTYLKHMRGLPSIWDGTNKGHQLSCHDDGKRDEAWNGGGKRIFKARTTTTTSW